MKNKYVSYLPEAVSRQLGVLDSLEFIRRQVLSEAYPVITFLNMQPLVRILAEISGINRVDNKRVEEAMIVVPSSVSFQFLFEPTS